VLHAMHAFTATPCFTSATLEVAYEP